MRRFGGRLLDLLLLVALAWTLYDEARHLWWYERSAGRQAVFAAIDAAATLTLIAIAVYELQHLRGATGRLDQYLRARPALYALSPFLIAALCWGTYRDLVHFNHQYLAAEGPFGDEFDAIAAAVLCLGVLKIAHHAWSALRLLLARSRPTPTV